MFHRSLFVFIENLVRNSSEIEFKYQTAINILLSSVCHDNMIWCPVNILIGMRLLCVCLWLVMETNHAIDMLYTSLHILLLRLTKKIS